MVFEKQKLKIKLKVQTNKNNFTKKINHKY